MIVAQIRAGSGDRPFVAAATDGRRTFLLPSETRRMAVAMAPALVRALAQANR